MKNISFLLFKYEKQHAGAGQGESVICQKKSKTTRYTCFALNWCAISQSTLHAFQLTL